MEIFIYQREGIPAEWAVEAVDVDGDGGCDLTLFSGPDCEARAREYAVLRYPGQQARPLPVRAGEPKS